MSSKEYIKIAIVGGTGKIGRSLVKKALDEGYSIRLLVRNLEKLTISDNQIEIIKGDARDIESINLLLDGCNCVISTLGQSKNELPVFSTATNNIITAMKNKGINRYILVTGGGVDMPGDKKDIKSKLVSKVMSWVFPAIMSDKQKEAKALQDSEIDWTLVRLPYVKENLPIGEIKVSLEHMSGQSINSRDIASFLIRQISDTQYVKKAPFISN